MKISKKIISVILAIMMLLMMFPIGGSAKTLEDIQAEIDEQNKKLEELANKKDKQEEYIEELNKQIDAYDEQLDIINAEIDDLNKSISALDKSIAEFERKISALETEIESVNVKIEEQNVKIDETYDLLAKRLRAVYMAGETSELEIFLTSSDFQEYLTRSELVRQVSKHDTQVVNELKEQIGELNDLNDKLVADKEELVASKSELDADRLELEDKKVTVVSKKQTFDSKRKQVEAQIRKANELIADLDEDSKLAQKLLEQAKREEEEFASNVDQELGNTGSNGNGTINNGVVNHKFRVSSKGMICPLQDKTTYISSSCKDHMSTSRSVAVDFCAPGTRVINGKTYHNVSRGATIYAVATGTVYKVSYDSRSGNYFIIDHGNGITTLYAHCDSISVTAGQKVAQGQAVAKVGNTGYVIPGPTTSRPSAGAHLHFEVRLNGVRQNPELYMPSPLV